MFKNNFYNRINNLFSFKKISIPKNILNDNINDRFKVIKTHKNNTALIFFTQKNFFRKFSTSKKGKKKIVSEYKGTKWYAEKSKRDFRSVIQNYHNRDSFAFIDLKNISGVKMKSWDKLEVNFQALKKVFTHYMSYTKGKKDIINGDLTLDNIIFKKNKVHIIDWEFFDSRKRLAGYDITYLFLSAACLPYIIGKKFTAKDKDLFKKLWRKLIKRKFNKKMLNNPFIFFENSIKKNTVLKESMILSKSKFFPFITPNSHKSNILKLIASLNYEK